MLLALPFETVLFIAGRKKTLHNIETLPKLFSKAIISTRSSSSKQAKDLTPPMIYEQTRNIVYIYVHPIHNPQPERSQLF